MDNTLILELFTKKSYDDVGGKKAIDKMSISIAGIYDYSNSNLQFYEEEAIQSLIEKLKSSSLIVGINLKKFGYRVLSAFTDYDFDNLTTLDLISSIKKKLSFPPTYEGIFDGTLDIHKQLRNENFIPRLFKQGRYDEIKTFCESNILDMKKLYDFGKKKGYIFYNEKFGQRWKISVDW